MNTPLPDFELVEIEKITGLDKRYRKNPEKQLKELADSIDTHGLLNPIVVTTDLELVAGHRRLLAVQSLGYEQIEAHIVKGLDEASKLSIEYDENICRVQMTEAERIALFNARLPQAQEEAKQRKSEGAKAKGQGSGTVPDAGQARDAAAVGAEESGKSLEKKSKTLEKIEAIVAGPETPESVRAVAISGLEAFNAGEKKILEVQKDVTAAQKVHAKAVAEAEKAAAAEESDDDAPPVDDTPVFHDQAKVLKAAQSALEKHAAALESAFVGVDNFDADCNPELVKESFKALRAAWSRFNAVSKAIAEIGA
jgi:ParB-like nuclease domain